MDGRIAKNLKEEELLGGYILFEPTSDKAPVAHFADRPSAIKAAHAMARKYEGKQFFVCKLVGVAAVTKVTYMDIDG